MKIPTRINFAGLTERLAEAHKDDRGFLFEYEVYSFLSSLGAETPPQCQLIQRGEIPSDESIMAIPGEKAVLKIVSPTIIHKTEVGGVRVVDKEPNKVRSAMRRMLYEVPENYARWIEANQEAAPESYQGLSGEALVTAISGDLKGVLQVQFMPPDSDAFGNELIVGLRNTREFGTVLSAGLGGTDTELYAERFRKGQAIVAASVEMSDGDQFFELFKKTISYRKLAGLTRGQRRIVTDEQLIECFSAFIEVGRYFSSANPDAPFVIDELEINPFAFTDYLMIPLDGLCKFSLPEKLAPTRPVEKVKSVVLPDSIGVIGVSTKRMNFGRIILKNILDAGFDKDHVYVIKDGIDEVDGVKCLPDVSAVPEKLDLFVVAVGAPMVPDLVDEVLESGNVNSVLLIPGGMGETEESVDRAADLSRKINKAHEAGTGPVFLGANSMGVVSHPGKFDTWFIPENKFPKSAGKPYNKTALISQSGAFILTRLAQCPQLEPAYLISMGNQNDLTLGDMATYFKDVDDVDVIAIYAEGFKDLDGLAFCRAVREAVLAGKEVIFYKAGRTEAGKDATAGHTASLAGDYMVCESCVHQAGAIVARNFTEFQNLVLLAQRLNSKPIRGNRLAALSAAGFEAVGMADSIESDDFSMQLAPLRPATQQTLTNLFQEKRLDSLVTIRNPLDITPAADDDTHIKAARALCNDPGVDAVVAALVPMSPSLQVTMDNVADDEPDDGLVGRLKELVDSTQTPLVCSVDAGMLYEPMVRRLMDAGIPVFQTCDMAVSALSQYIEGRLNATRIRG
ncbi:acetate--CoA ligase family protein [Pseudodesulfovibrio sp. zrk46]|uniref:acetate--CoA ligase family protein n=1 Tax=Pseudodesulfovibrio sp. zrk46 TaxID=2725288 RepID=UPI0014493C62|nr:acetate--CoA ligase family protein [Pseudodesulfovibrio sp. zrk46]QJB58265.1 CoA-binding protein [Pseudodesulfovibrio sp. zrk46]